MAIIMPTDIMAKGVIDKQLKDLEALQKAAKTDAEKVDIGIKLVTLCTTHNDSRCVSYANQTVKLANKINRQQKAADVYYLVGNYYFNSKSYRNAASQFEQEYAIRKKLQQARPRAVTCYNLGKCYYNIKMYKKAIKYYEEARDLATKRFKDPGMRDRALRALCDVAQAEKDYKKAFEYLNTYLREENKRFRDENQQLMDLTEEQEQTIQLKDSTIQIRDTMIAVAEQEKQALRWHADSLEMEKARQQLRIEKQQQQLENEQLRAEKAERDAKIQEQRMWIWVTVAFAVLLACAGSVYLYFQKRETAKELAKKNAQISEQKEEIQERNLEISKNLEVIELKNKDIMDSITYASKIQGSLLTDMDQYKQIMSDYFVYYAPKDIVSGDFYWAHMARNKFIFTVGDCTGHSVPGAFMSMLGIALLNQIVAQQHVVKASLILENMRSMVKLYLGQNEVSEGPKDGMDMAICVWDLETNVINFSGAYNPLVFISDGKLQVFNAVKSPVGIHTRELDFTDQYIPVKKGDKLYMFSDGFSDQFSARNQEKFKMARFRQLLLDTCTLPMGRQCEKLKNAYLEWKGDFIQIDDVSVMGVEI